MSGEYRVRYGPAGGKNDVGGLFEIGMVWVALWQTIGYGPLWKNMGVVGERRSSAVLRSGIRLGAWCQCRTGDRRICVRIGPVLLARVCGKACKPHLSLPHFSYSRFGQTFPTHAKSHELALLREPRYHRPRVTIACPALRTGHSSNRAGTLNPAVRPCPVVGQR